MIICYENARIFTGNGDPADCMVVRDGRFEFVGQAGVARKRFPDAERIDLEGRFVCPGFNDSHMHLLNYGNSLEQCNLSRCTGSVAQLQNGLRAFLREHANPALTVLVKTPDNQDALSDMAPFTDPYPIPSHGARYYLCRGGTCSAPVDKISELNLND